MAACRTLAVSGLKPKANIVSRSVFARAFYFEFHTCCFYLDSMKIATE